MDSNPRNFLNQELAEGIRRVGFRKWYERELLSSHAHLLLLVLASVALIGSFEAFGGATASEKLMDLLFIIACTAIAVWALRRYLYLLAHAESVANQAVCAVCESYGRFEVVSENRHAHQTMVRCRKCQHVWPITG